MNETIYSVVMNTLEQINQSRDSAIDLTPGREIVLYGRNGVFDSLGLVGFLVSLEEAIQDELGKTVTLATEKAVSRRVSPFSSVAALIQFVAEEVTHGEHPANEIPVPAT